ncbi:unnamed protein product [Periconia digitata]|uniref:Amino acid permease/ SLC12A domain-containing protein n=1 Tax=Periconia digitata TaxID=1303443 RepID=A0A9W4UGN2_9PLEO|nr:unnamed protein product [Periconia digitata]
MTKQQRPLDRSPYYVDHFEHLDRVLNRPQLTGIGISGCIGVGIFVTSGQLITTSGSLGGPLSYVIAGIISACVLYTLTEMVASRPLTGALIDLPHHFLHPAAGFAVAASYSLANIFSMATLTAYSAEVTALLKDDQKKHPTGVEVGINIAFIALTTLSHCMGVKLYGRIERVIMVFKLCLFVLCCVLMIVVNAGGAGQRTGSYRGNYTTYAFPPGLKPARFNSTSNVSVHPSGVPDSDFGLPGSGGRLFGFLTSVTFAMFSCVGGEMTAMTAGESKEPWKDVPIVMSFVYLVPLTLYPFVLMSAAANVNYADPSLSGIWGAENGNITLSPFVVAVQTSALGGVSKSLNLFFIISAYTAGNTALYVASRSVFMLAQTYLHPRIADVFGKTNNGHTPLRAILLCSAFGFIALSGLSHHAYSQPRQTMSSFYTGSLATVYICECVTFLKFKAGLARLERRQILSRNDALYISRMFKSRWQPLPAYIGIAGCSFIIIWSGVPALWIICSNRPGEPRLKNKVALGCDVLGAWIGPLIFAGLYLSYKYTHPHSRAVDVRDLTPSDYVLSDLGEIPSPLERSTPRSPFSSPQPTATINQHLPHLYPEHSNDNNYSHNRNTSNNEAPVELAPIGTTTMAANSIPQSHGMTAAGASWGWEGPLSAAAAISPPTSPTATAAAPNPDFTYENTTNALGITQTLTHTSSHPSTAPHTHITQPTHAHNRTSYPHAGDAGFDFDFNGGGGNDVGMISAEILEELEEEQAREEERARINDVLMKRPRRMERGLARELWSCLVAD